MRPSHMLPVFCLSVISATSYAQRGAIRTVPSRGIVKGSSGEAVKIDGISNSSIGLQGTSSGLNLNRNPPNPNSNSGSVLTNRFETITPENMPNEADLSKFDGEISDATARLIDKAQPNAEGENNVAEFAAEARDWTSPRAKQNFLKLMLEADKIAEQSNGKLTADAAVVQAAEARNMRQRIRKSCKKSWM